MSKVLCLYVDHRGGVPVWEYILDLTFKEKTKAVAYLMELKEHCHNLRRPMADYIGEGIYELRPKNNRIFYFFYLKDKIVVLHAIKKKTDKIPIEDFNLCVKRKKEVEMLNNIQDLELN